MQRRRPEHTWAEPNGHLNLKMAESRRQLFAKPSQPFHCVTQVTRSTVAMSGYVTIYSLGWMTHGLVSFERSPASAQRRRISISMASGSRDRGGTKPERSFSF